MTTILILYLVVGTLLIVVALPLLQGKIPPNPWYGFRLPSTLNDPRIWYATNTYFAKRLIVAGACTAFSAIALYYVRGLTIDRYAWLCLGAFSLVFVVGLVQSVRYMKSLARDQNAR